MIYKKTLIIATVAVAILMAFAGIARAATAITVGDGWHSFGSPNHDPYTQSPFTFTAGGAVVVTVTDVLCPGDVYSVFDGSTMLGTTSTPGSSDCGYAGNTPDPGTALADPTYSHGAWAVEPGAHSVGIALFSSPFPGSGGYVRVDELTMDTCKNGGWASIQSFTSPGQCVHAAVKKFH